MKRLLLLLLPATCLLLLSCSTLPQVHKVEGTTAAQIERICRNPFPKGKWQFVHSIEAVMPHGRSIFVTGVTVISSADRSFRCVIMTMEGLVIFDATYRKRLTINRAISPFDSQVFAEGLARDIRLIFLHPPGPPVESGFLEDGTSICRYRSTDGGLVDVVCRGSGKWEIYRYDHDLRLLRTVRFTPGKETGADKNIPRRIELTAYGSKGYKLIMDLIEAVRIEE